MNNHDVVATVLYCIQQFFQISFSMTGHSNVVNHVIRGWFWPSHPRRLNAHELQVICAIYSRPPEAQVFGGVNNVSRPLQKTDKCGKALTSHAIAEYGHAFAPQQSGKTAYLFIELAQRGLIYSTFPHIASTRLQADSLSQALGIVTNCVPSDLS